MIVKIAAQQRGRTELNWLDSYHTFSFGQYWNPNRAGFSALRVINEDFVAPGMGFMEHPHKDMEILSYVVSGSLRHQDSLGNQSIIKAGELQLLSAGTGIFHSEFNNSSSEVTRFFQIWIRPQENGLPPNYQQRISPHLTKINLLTLLVGPTAAPIKINQDVKISGLQVEKNKIVTITLSLDRYFWLQVVKGEIGLQEINLKESDGAAITELTTINLSAITDAEILLFDLPAVGARLS